MWRAHGLVKGAWARRQWAASGGSALCLAAMSWVGAGSSGAGHGLGLDIGRAGNCRKVKGVGVLSEGPGLGKTLRKTLH